MGLTVKKQQPELDEEEEEAPEEDEEEGSVALFEQGSSELLVEGEALDREDEDDALNEVTFHGFFKTNRGNE